MYRLYHVFRTFHCVRVCVHAQARVYNFIFSGTNGTTPFFYPLTRRDAVPFAKAHTVQQACLLSEKCL